MTSDTSLFAKGAKPRAVEELVDFYIHRRLAVPVVRAAAALGLTPNQVTVLSLVLGCAAAFFYWKSRFVAGSLFLLGAVVFDCADGMLARVTGQASPTGRILDGFLDMIWVVLTWMGLYFSGFFAGTPHLLALMAAAGASMPLHCWTYDSVKTSYLGLREPDFSDQHLDAKEAARRMKESYGRRRYLDAFIYLLMAVHHGVFIRSPSKPSPRPPAKNGENLLFPMRVWSFLGEGMHLTLIYVGGFLTPLWKPSLLVIFVVMLIPMNLLWIYASVLWAVKKRKA